MRHFERNLSAYESEMDVQGLEPNNVLIDLLVGQLHTPVFGFSIDPSSRGARFEDLKRPGKVAGLEGIVVCLSVLVWFEELEFSLLIPLGLHFFFYSCLPISPSFV